MRVKSPMREGKSIGSLAREENSLGSPTSEGKGMWDHQKLRWRGRVWDHLRLRGRGRVHIFERLKQKRKSRLG